MKTNPPQEDSISSKLSLNGALATPNLAKQPTRKQAFNDLPAALSYNPDCKNCKANKLTIAQLNKEGEV